jgi:NAD(P)-dependent dehydrogenase (short-subunit alcohol dehydrogenase family)
MAYTLSRDHDLVTASVPMGRIGSPPDVAGTCIWLSGRAGAWITGATVAVDGGHLVFSSSKL